MQRRGVHSWCQANMARPSDPGFVAPARSFARAHPAAVLHTRADLTCKGVRARPDLPPRLAAQQRSPGHQHVRLQVQLRKLHRAKGRAVIHPGTRSLHNVAPLGQRPATNGHHLERLDGCRAQELRAKVDHDLVSIPLGKPVGKVEGHGIHAKASEASMSVSHQPQKNVCAGHTP